MSRYEEAKKMYAAFGVDTEAAMERLSKLSSAYTVGKGTTLSVLTAVIPFRAVFRRRVTIPAERELPKNCLPTLRRRLS